MSRNKRRKQTVATSQTNHKVPRYMALEGLDSPACKIPTPEQIRAWFGPPKTLGAPIEQAEQMRLAMDSVLDASGLYSLIGHAFEMGQPPAANSFVGYSTLAALRQNGLIAACIETVADDMLRAWITLTGGEAEKDNPEQIAKIEEAITRFKLRKIFQDAVIVTRYDGGCLIYIDTGAQGEQLRQPLNLSDKSGEFNIGKLRGFKVVEPINVFPGVYNSSNPIATDYFEPQSWWVLGQEIHASRFIKLSTGDVPLLFKPSYNFFGIPHAQTLWDYVLHFQQDRVASSRMLGKYSDLVFGVAGLREALTAPGGTTELERRVQYMARQRSNDGVAIIDLENESVQKLESHLSGLTDITRQDLEIICAINRTPAVKILGISPSGFNATGASDIRNYYDHVASQQEKLLHEGIARALDCLQLHLFGRIDPTIGFEFAKLGEEDRQLESGIRKANTDSLAALVMSEIISPEGARATVETNPDEYLVGLSDGIQAEANLYGSMAESDLDEFDISSPSQKPEATAQTGEETDVQQTSLNGAQVSSMVSIVSQVAQGQLPRDSGLNILLAAFNISPDQAEKIMGEAGRGFKVERPRPDAEEGAA